MNHFLKLNDSDGIELSIEFARSIGIGHDIRRNTQLLACLSIVPDNVPVLDQVIVEPASPGKAQIFPTIESSP